MRFASLIISLVLTGSTVAHASMQASGADTTVTAGSAFPTAVEPHKVGQYPMLVKSGAGYFYDDVLEYRVWLHPERGAKKRQGHSDYYVAFAQYEQARTFSQKTPGAEAPLVLMRQLEHIHEPRPGVYEVVKGERLTEWQVPWLQGAKRSPGAIERFLAQRRK